MLENIRLTTNVNELDFEVIYHFISNSYWAKDIPRETMKNAMSGALCFGVLDENDKLLAFARMITDKATFAYLADVFVLPEYQGQGISKWMMTRIMAHDDLQGLRRIMLATHDAHNLYKQFGFNAIETPELLMQIVSPNVYQV